MEKKWFIGSMWSESDKQRRGHSKINSIHGCDLENMMILAVITVVIACLSPVGSSHCLAIARNPQCVNLSRYSQLMESSQSQARGQIEPPNSVWCPESCQGFDCGVSERGARAATVVQCRIKRKRTRWVWELSRDYYGWKLSLREVHFSVFIDKPAS